MKKDREKKCECQHGMTRRGFLSMIGSGAMAVAVPGSLSAEAAKDAEVTNPEEMTKLTLFVNGHHHRLLVEPRWSLLYVIRERLGITGTKVGCERGECLLLSFCCLFLYLSLLNLAACTFLRCVTSLPTAMHRSSAPANSGITRFSVNASI
jgi:hypothetical protein